MFRRIFKSKGLILLATTVIICFLWMTSQVRGPGGKSLLERGLGSVAYPFVNAASLTSDGVSYVWHAYVYHVGLFEENEELKAENLSLKLENARLRRKAGRADRIESLIGFRKTVDYPTVGADVIARDPTNWFRSAWIDRGKDDGVLKNMPVMATGGLAGRVIKSFPGSSRVMLITDPASAVSCFTADGRVPGILEGEPDGTCTLNYVDKKAEVNVGDFVVTSGLDTVYPKDLPVGVVTAVEKDAPGYFQKIIVKPSANLDRMEEALVILYHEEVGE